MFVVLIQYPFINIWIPRHFFFNWFRISELEAIQSKPFELEFYLAYSDRQDSIDYISRWGTISFIYTTTTRAPTAMVKFLAPLLGSNLVQVFGAAAGN